MTGGLITAAVDGPGGPILAGNHTPVIRVTTVVASDEKYSGGHRMENDSDGHQNDERGIHVKNGSGWFFCYSKKPPCGNGGGH